MAIIASVALSANGRRARHRDDGRGAVHVGKPKEQAAWARQRLADHRTSSNSRSSGATPASSAIARSRAARPFIFQNEHAARPFRSAVDFYACRADPQCVGGGVAR